MLGTTGKNGDSFANLERSFSIKHNVWTGFAYMFEEEVSFTLFTQNC